MKRLFSFRSRSPRDIGADVDAELRFHIETRTDELVARGLAPDAARAQALGEFGDLEDARRYLRDVDLKTESERRRRNYVNELWQDIVYALRKLRAAPTFTITAILTLALGIGANTAIFSVVNGVLLRPLPFPHPERLLQVWSSQPAENHPRGAVSPIDLDDWRAQRKVLADLGGYYFQDGGSGIDFTGSGEPQRLSAAFITPGFFSTLGVSAEAGTLPREDQLVRGGPDHVVVLSHGFWQRQFGASPSVIGSTLILAGEPYQVIGVMPPAFVYPSERVELYVPYSTIPDHAIPRIRPVRILEVVARTIPGATLAQARSEMGVITGRLAQQYPEDASWGGATVMPLSDAITGNVRSGLVVLLVAVAFVLLMACVNVASLLLARAAVREREVAIRVSLGATRGRVVRQLLTESVVLAFAGGVAGLGVAALGTRLLLALAAGQLPRGADVHLDAPVLAFALGVSLVTGLCFGLVPALRAASADLHGTLRASGRGSISGASQRLRNGLVVAQVALAVMLVVGAGLMTKSFVALLRVDPGFRPGRLLAVNFTLSTVRHPAPLYTQYYADIIAKVRTIPGVVAAGATRDAPFRGDGERSSFLPPGVVQRAGEELPTASFHFVSDGYFHTLGTPVVAGREFTPQDRAGGPFVVVINQTLAKQFFAGTDPVGKTIRINGAREAQVVGVVGDIRQAAVESPPRPTIYLDNMLESRARTNLVVRTQGEPLAMARTIREAIWSLDKDQTITSIYTFDDIMHEAVARPRLLTVLLGFFGAIGLALGAIGIYGVLAYLVNQRRREIGVRLALGATAAGVLAMFVRRGMVLAGVGVVVGLVGALGLSRFLKGVLYGVEATDPITFAGVAVVMIGVAGIASYAPARRAAGVDPAVVLRDE